MSDIDEPAPWWHPGELLRPGPSAVVAFALAVLVLMASNQMVNATNVLFNEWYTPSTGLAPFITAWVLGAIVPALASILLARRAVLAGDVAGWELVLARSAVVLAAIGILYTLLMFAGAAYHLD